MTTDATPSPSRESGTRDAQRTRAAILAAAADAAAEEGMGVSLASIAARASVTKSGLLHHFASRESLFKALAVATVQGFRNRVHRRVDLSENRPGKLLRAYVHVLCDDVEFEGVESAEFEPEYWAVVLALHTVPQVAATLAEDVEYWSHELLADGADPITAQIIRLTVDGLNSLALVSPEHARVLAPDLRAKLLTLV